MSLIQSRQPIKYPSVDMTADTSVILSPIENQTFFLDMNKYTNNILASQATSSSRMTRRNFHNPKEKYTPEEDPESSSSVILEDFQDFIFLNCKKTHGSHGSFSHQHGINLKKIRKSRYSEYCPRKTLDLQVDDDVQPEITSFKASFIDLKYRQRAESCYTKIKTKKSLGNLALISQESIESVESSESVIVNSPDPDSNSEDFNCNIEQISEFSKEKKNEKAIKKKNEKNEYLNSQNSEKNNDNYINIVNTSEQKVSKTYVTLILDESSLENSAIINISCIEEIHSNNDTLIVDNSENNISRSIESISDINGKIFMHFDKRLLCEIPVCSFSEIIEEFKNIIILSDSFSSKSSIFQRDFLCCFESQKIHQQDQENIEKLIKFSYEKFDFSNIFHLKILLATYCSITNQQDWPNHDNEWLEMGFSSTDLLEELKSDGLIGLLYIFFLSAFFPRFLSEMLGVCRYFSYEVFKVCKYFAMDTIQLIKKKTLNKQFSKENQALEMNFLFYTGMVIE